MLEYDSSSKLYLVKRARAPDYLLEAGAGQRKASKQQEAEGGGGRKGT